MDRFRVLLITPVMGIGGEELFTITLASELKRRGNQVFVMGGLGPIIQEFKDRGLEVIIGPVQGRSILGVIKGACFLRRFIAQKKIQIIHSQSVIPTIMGYLASRTLIRQKPRVIWHAHGIKHHSLVARCFNFLADFVIVNSNFERDKLIRNGLSNSHIKRIYNCIAIEFPEKLDNSRDFFDEWKIGKECQVVGIISRLVIQKGHCYFLEAAKKVLEKLKNTIFLIVGDGPLMPELHDLVNHLGIDINVIFTGWRRDLKRIYSAIDILAFPSLWEPFGIVAIEAAAFGKPVIGSDVDGIREAVVDRLTGILIPTKDPDALARAMMRLLENPSLAQSMGQAGRERVKKYFTPKRLGDEIEEVYASLLGKNKINCEFDRPNAIAS